MKLYEVQNTAGFSELIVAERVEFNESTGQKILYIGNEIVAVAPIQAMVRITQSRAEILKYDPTKQ